jgi:hypothetical protein
MQLGRLADAYWDVERRSDGTRTRDLRRDRCVKVDSAGFI